MSNQNTNYYGETSSTLSVSLQKYVRGVIVQMALGLAVTAGVSFVCYLSLIHGGIAYQVFSRAPYLVWILLVAELGVAFAFSLGLEKFSYGTVVALFYGYAVLTGISFTTLFLVYDLGTIFLAFAFSAVFFGAMAVIGYTTNADLTKFGPILYSGLIAIIIMSIVGIIFHLEMISMAVAYIGLVLFIIFTAYDMQRIKQYYYVLGADSERGQKFAIYGAMQLYLDFINMFLKILRILGNRNRSNN